MDGLHSEFQGSLGYVERLFLLKTKPYIFRKTDSSLVKFHFVLLDGFMSL